AAGMSGGRPMTVTDRPTAARLALVAGAELEALATALLGEIRAIEQDLGEMNRGEGAGARLPHADYEAVRRQVVQARREKLAQYQQVKAELKRRRVAAQGAPVTPDGLVGDDALVARAFEVVRQLLVGREPTPEQLAVMNALRARALAAR